MTAATFTLKNDYWENFLLNEKDLESLYNILLEKETPLPTNELVRLVIEERITDERKAMERRKSAGGDIYFPKNEYEVGQTIIFPSHEWERGTVAGKRKGFNPDLPDFEVIEVNFESGATREFAIGIVDHPLNTPPEMSEETGFNNPDNVIEEFGEYIGDLLEEDLSTSDEFVRIAGRWFPRALLVEINVGHLNLAEAVLDMEGGGPLPTRRLLEMVDTPKNVNKSLAEFSLDFALWRDERFDEVGPAGQILWYLQRLEPKAVLETPKYLKYFQVDYDPEELTDEMFELEKELDDELSNLQVTGGGVTEVEIRLTYPHWRSGTLPLSSRLLKLLPTAYQAPRIRFTLVDGKSGDKFPAWVVRSGKFVYGLEKYYEENGVFPGALISIRKGDTPGEVIVEAGKKRETREWLRTVLTGSDGGLVLAMLKQFVKAKYDERMAIAVPDFSALDKVWEKHSKDRTPFEKIVVSMFRELAKLNPQGNVHASELYAAVNLVRRSPPGPIFALLTTRPWFQHVGDLYFKLDETIHN